MAYNLNDLTQKAVLELRASWQECEAIVRPKKDLMCRAFPSSFVERGVTDDVRGLYDLCLAQNLRIRQLEQTLAYLDNDSLALIVQTIKRRGGLNGT